jgi:hypothetical protein
VIASCHTLRFSKDVVHLRDEADCLGHGEIALERSASNPPIPVFALPWRHVGDFYGLKRNPMNIIASGLIFG